MARISYTGTTNSQGVANTTITGQGKGRLKYISKCDDLWSNSYEVLDCLYIETIPNGSLTQGQITHQNLGNSSIELSDEWATVGDYSIKSKVVSSSWSAYRILTPNIPSNEVTVEFDYKSDSSFTAIVVFGRTGETEVYERIRNIPSGEGSKKITLSTSSTSIISKVDLRPVGVSSTDYATVYFDNIRIYSPSHTPKHYTPIALSSSASIIQTGESATLTAELTNVLGQKMANTNVDFIEDDTVIATATTNTNGIATTTLNGTGKGIRQVTARNGTIQSGIYEVIDGTFLDRATSTDHNDNWEFIANKVSRSYTSDGTATVLTMATGQTWGYVFVNNTNYKFDLPLCIEYDLVAVEDSPRIRFKGDTSSFAYILSNYGTGHYKWIISKTDISLTVDGVSKSVALSMDRENGLGIYWEFDSDTDGLTYKNFVVYPI